MERRLGPRRPVSWLQISWSVIRRGRWKNRHVEEPIVALDASTSGMGVRAETVPGLAVGHRVELLLGGFEVTARVRRVMATADPRSTDYGLEFIDPPAAFIETVLTQTGAAPDDALELYWQRAL